MRQQGGKVAGVDVFAAGHAARVAVVIAEQVPLPRCRVGWVKDLEKQGEHWRCSFRG